MNWKEIDKMFQGKRVDRIVLKFRNKRYTRKTIVYQMKNYWINEFYHILGSQKLCFHGWDIPNDHEYVDFEIKNLEMLEETYNKFNRDEYNYENDM